VFYEWHCVINWLTVLYWSIQLYSCQSVQQTYFTLLYFTFTPSPLFLSSIPIPIPWFKISLTQWVTLSFGVQENHPLVFSNTKIMFTWHICYTSNSASSQFRVQSMITLKIRRPTPWYYRNKSPRSHGITVKLVPIPAVLPWTLSPLPRSNRGYRGKTVIPVPVQLSCGLPSTSSFRLSYHEVN